VVARAFNIADLFELVADAVPHRTAVVEGDRRLTYRELDARATRLAAALAARGVGPGDHVGVCLHNTCAHVEALLAAFKLRAVPVNVNYRYTAAELAELARDAELVALVHHADMADRMPPVRLLVDADGDAYEELLASGAPEADFGPRSGDDHYVLYTGGTTGKPKGVVWRHEDIFFAALGGGNPGGPPISRPEGIAACVVANRAGRLAPFLPPGEAPPDEFGVLSLGPMIHASGNWSALGTLLSGGKLVLYHARHFDPQLVCDLVEAERVTMLNVVGDVTARPLVELLESPEGRRWDTTSVRLVGSGGTLLTAAVKQRLFACFPALLAITEAIGSSESPVQGLAVVTRDGAPRARTLRFAPKPETAVLDDDLRPVEPGSGRVGRLATTGRVPLAYHNDPERSATTFVEIDGKRWALPGDMATVEADGTIRLLGRGALCINTGGEKVWPEEVEAVLRSHPGVADAAVVGVPDPRWGERVAAVVQPADPAAPPSLADLQAHCRTALAGYKVPRSVHLVAAVERTAAGKVDYRWAAEVARSQPGGTGRRVEP
jgi:fatty-acyl-CoA synthase